MSVYLLPRSPWGLPGPFQTPIGIIRDKKGSKKRKKRGGGSNTLEKKKIGRFDNWKRIRDGIQLIVHGYSVNAPE